MRSVFADSMYWIALTSPHDQWHKAAIKISQSLRETQIVTTEEVLSEFLAHFCGHGRTVRLGAIRAVEEIQGNPAVFIREQSHQSFLAGMALYMNRPDKGYSHTDCISMEAMRQEGITEILTHDAHFRQEGFTILL